MKKMIVILGAGESGIGAALLGKSRGYRVFVSDIGKINSSLIKEMDSNQIDYEQNVHSEEKILTSDLVIKSPGIPDTSLIVQKIKAAGIEVISEVEFAFRHTKSKIIGITGTNGKTTTTELTCHLLKSGGKDVAVCGNIGTSMARLVSEKEREWLVVELSSFQLDDVVEFHPRIAIVLNITPDHLNRYRDFNHYTNSKMNLLNRMGMNDPIIYWKEDKGLNEKISSKEGIIIPVSISDSSVAYHSEKGMLYFDSYSLKEKELTLRGDHNYINIMCAVAAAIKAGVSFDDVRLGLKTFKGIPHRMEYVDTIDGVSFINDSKATNVEAVYYALDTFDGSVTWIVGGQDKGNDYTKIYPLVKEKVRTIICLGLDNTKIREVFDGVSAHFEETIDVKEAAILGLKYSERNDVVLLSPACASFDLFKSYEDRGDQFRNAVKELKISHNQTHA